MAVIPGVSDGELIRTTWGDAVADELNLRCVKNNANASMSGTLTVAGAITANNQIVISDTAPTSDSHAARKDYVDAAVATSANARVAVAGDTMTGNLQVGGNPSTAAGSRIGNEGSIATHVTAAAGGTNGTANLTLDRTGTSAGEPAVVGATFVDFRRHGVAIGSIKISSAPGVAYNETSDYRLKDVVGEVDDPLGVINALQAHHLRWKASDVEFDGFIAHEVQAVVPYAVTGAKDAVLPPTDEFNPGGVDPQQLDTGKLIPYLVGAIQVLAARLDALEAAP